MGCASSAGALTGEEKRVADAEYKHSKDIDAQNSKDLENDAKVCKLLLLGAGESGKSTLFKQILTIYGAGLSQKQFEQFSPSIHQLTIASMKQLCVQADRLGSTSEEYRIAPGENEKSKLFLLGLPDDISFIDREIARHIERLWEDPAIKATFAKRSTFQLVDTADYFFGRVNALSNEDYCPTYEDVLRCRVRTTGIVENRFEIAGHKFLLVDVGGQRNERKKWIHCFEGVTAVIFVTSLSEYDQNLFEDNHTPRIIESISLFEEVLNMKWFLNCPVILFLNKRDLFEAKLKVAPLSNVFPDYKGGAEFDEGVQYILKRFTDKVDQRRKPMIFSHVTCAMDKDNVQHVFDDVKEILIRKAISSAGLDAL
jgi:guanine nucleotide-binding protein G(i) subunit alpha